MIDLSKLSRNGKYFFLAYDQGLEHGPSDFNLSSANPEYVFDLTKSGYFTGIVTQKGIAEKYYRPDVYKVPLIIKLNGKTHFIDEEPYSPQICSVEEAVRLRARAVGYTVYVGSEQESQMFKEFSNIIYEAHDMGIPVIGWMYPRGKRVGEETTDITAYAARVGLELGADMVNVRYTGNVDGMKWVIACAGAMPTCIPGGSKIDNAGLMTEVKGAMDAGCMGAVIGRNIWQDEKPLDRAKELADIIYTD